MKFGIFDHVDDNGLELGVLYDNRLRLIEAFDQSGIHCYHLAEHHFTPLGMSPSPSVSEYFSCKTSVISCSVAPPSGMRLSSDARILSSSFVKCTSLNAPFTTSTTLCQNAASIAGLLITTEAMVAELPKKNSPAMPAMPGGGGMDF